MFTRPIHWNKKQIKQKKSGKKKQTSCRWLEICSPRKAPVKLIILSCYKKLQFTNFLYILMVSTSLIGLHVSVITKKGDYIREMFCPVAVVYLELAKSFKSKISQSWRQLNDLFSQYKPQINDGNLNYRIAFTHVVIKETHFFITHAQPY